MIPNSPLKNILLSMLLLAVSLTACDLEISEISEIPEIKSLTSLIQNITVINSGKLTTFTPEPSQQETDITFQVQLPENTPAGETIFLSVLDEVTGLALNPEYYPMEAKEGQSEGTDPSEQIYSINLRCKIYFYTISICCSFKVRVLCTSGFEAGRFLWFLTKKSVMSPPWIIWILINEFPKSFEEIGKICLVKGSRTKSMSYGEYIGYTRFEFFKIAIGVKTESVIIILKVFILLQPIKINFNTGKRLV